MPELRQNALIVNLRYQTTAGTRVQSIGGYPDEQTQPEIQGPKGRYRLLENHLTDLRFEQNGMRPENLQLTIPEIYVEEQENPVKLKIPIPAAGASRNLDTKLVLGQYNIFITRVERIDNSLRVYVDSQAQAGWRLTGFNLEDSKRADSGLSYMTQGDEKTRKIKYFEVDLSELSRDGDYVVLVLKNPQSIVQGPWVFNIKKEKILIHSSYHLKDAMKTNEPKT